MFSLLLFFLNLSVWGVGVLGYPEEGKWNCTLDPNVPGISISKSLFAGSEIFIDIVCEAKNPQSKIVIDWFLTESTCWNDHQPIEGNDKNDLNLWGDSCDLCQPGYSLPSCFPEEKYTHFDSSSIKGNRIAGDEVTVTCSGHVMLNEVKVFGGKGPPSNVDLPKTSPSQKSQEDDLISVQEKAEALQKPQEGGRSRRADTSSPLFVIPKDGFYTFILKMMGTDFKAEVHVKMKGEHGYLSAADWPLLPFYGVMCLVYVVFGLVWLIVSFCQWRELLRIQFWIGGVILLGMLEKATFYADYQNINTTGVNVKAAVLLAEWVSCAKRTLARMLVIIVSLGFGIVKPRLGSMLHRLVGVGAFYFILAVVESYIRVMHSKNDPSNQLLMAGIPLAVLDFAIYWWIFTALIQTTRTLRLRRNLVKLNLYRHFMNTLIFAVLASVVFMLYSMKVHRLALCLTDWKDLWVDEAYWHVLFSVLLLVIMILWRPTNNNQRYAFTPLLDAAEDDEEEEDQFVNDAYGVKMRTHSRPTSPKPKPSNDNEVLKWVDENIPSAGMEAALPIFDSEEEILTTKFEMSKMQ